MKIDFNNVRLSAIKNYNLIIKELNSGLDKEDEYFLNLNNIKYLQKKLDSLRSDLIGIAASYIDGDENCKCVLTDDIHLEYFNPLGDE